MTQQPEFGPLAGVKVINAALSVAGPFAAQLMADGSPVLVVARLKGCPSE